MVISFSGWHWLLGCICQEGRGRRGIACGLTRDNGVRDHRLVRVDGDVLHDDLLLPAASSLSVNIASVREALSASCR